MRRDASQTPGMACSRLKLSPPVSRQHVTTWPPPVGTTTVVWTPWGHRRAPDKARADPGPVLPPVTLLAHANVTRSQGRGVVSHPVVAAAVAVTATVAVVVAGTVELGTVGIGNVPLMPPHPTYPHAQGLGRALPPTCRTSRSSPRWHNTRSGTRLAEGVCHPKNASTCLTPLL